MRIQNDILNIIDSSIVKDNILFLPDVKLDRNTYQRVNKAIEAIGGTWNRKAKGHVFECDPRELIENLLITGEVTDIKKEFQYFPTPNDIAKRMIDMADIKPGELLLEPSAGQGAIADLFPKENPYVLIEFNENNARILTEKGYDVSIMDFLKSDFIGADKVIMNPPFSNQQDIDHINHALNMLNAGGTLVSIVSEGPFFRQNKKSINFMAMLEHYNAEVIELPEGAFKESGTMIKTRIIKVIK